MMAYTPLPGRGSPQTRSGGREPGEGFRGRRESSLRERGLSPEGEEE
jgi:hypothetical protein